MANRKGPGALPCVILHFKGDMKGPSVYRAPGADSVDVVNWVCWENEPYAPGVTHWLHM